MRRSTWRQFSLVSIVTVSLLFSGCAVKFSADVCQKDSDCFFDEICEVNRCISTSGSFEPNPDNPASPVGNLGAGNETADALKTSTVGLGLEIRFFPEGGSALGTVDMGLCPDAFAQKMEVEGRMICTGGVMLRLTVRDGGEGLKATIYRHKVGDPRWTDAKSYDIAFKRDYVLNVRYYNRTYVATLRSGEEQVFEWQSKSDHFFNYNEVVFSNWDAVPFASSEEWLQLKLREIVVRSAGQVIFEEKFVEGSMINEGKSAWCMMTPNSMMTLGKGWSILSFSNMVSQAMYSCFSDRCPPDTKECNRFHSQ